MKTANAIQRAGTARALAKLLGITGGAISQWGENLPQAREWQLRLLKPEWFSKNDLSASNAHQLHITATNLVAEKQGSHDSE